MRTQATETPQKHGGNHPITRTEYNALLERLEDVEDALDLLTAQEEGASSDAWPSNLCDRMLAGEHPLRLWREHRGITLDALSKATNISAGYISEIESNKKPGSAVSLNKCAVVLGVHVEDLINMTRRHTATAQANKKTKEKKQKTKHYQTSLSGS